MPGLAANSQIFKYISLPDDKFVLHYLEWLLPESIDESIEDYAKRMCKFIKEKNVILIGVSFGGIIVQEMAKIMKPIKLVIISSIKSNKELSKRLRLIKVSKTYKLFPENNITALENLIHAYASKKIQKRLEHYKIYLSMRDPLYLKWAIYNALHWKQEKVIPNILHIHGTADHIFPIKYINNCVPIENGEHVMIIIKAKEISKILSEYL